jgi:hypothetical protein
LELFFEESDGLRVFGRVTEVIGFFADRLLAGLRGGGVFAAMMKN